MKKKLLIIFGSVFAVIALLVILCFTLFALRSVKVNFRTSIDANIPSQEEIVEAGDFSYRMPVFFLSKKSYKKNIEEKFPYVEVINIETRFPGKLIVHIRERQEIYAFIHNGRTYFCDNNLVVLRFEENSGYVSSQENSILIEGLELGSEEINIGDRLVSATYVDVYDALVENNRLFFEQQSIIKKIIFSSTVDNNTNKKATSFVINTFDNHEFRVYNSDKYLRVKMAKFLSAYSNLYEYIGKPITQDSASEYYGQVWTADMLDSAYVVINNYYNVTSESKSCYANVFPAEKVQV